VLLLRLLRHIKFRNPDASMRRELFALQLPNQDRMQADFSALADLSRGLSGWAILNICINAIYVGSMNPNAERWMVTQEMLEREIARAKKAKAEHAGKNGKTRKRIGFKPS
jgi:ATP-dependent 26S proteasome regulatory subunit